jgi:hypothetical protein
VDVVEPKNIEQEEFKSKNKCVNRHTLIGDCGRGGGGRTSPIK